VPLLVVYCQYLRRDVRPEWPAMEYVPPAL
jgi:hypothetical protein